LIRLSIFVYEYTNIPMHLKITTSRCIPYYATIIILVILVVIMQKICFPFMLPSETSQTNLRSKLNEMKFTSCFPMKTMNLILAKLTYHSQLMVWEEVREKEEWKKDPFQFLGNMDGCCIISLGYHVSLYNVCAIL